VALNGLELSVPNFVVLAEFSTSSQMKIHTGYIDDVSTECKQQLSIITALVMAPF